jgi:hypothetical protein
VASVNGSGLVTGNAQGSATITATSEGKSGTAQVTVTALPPTDAEPADPGSGYLWQENYDRYTSVPSMFSTGNCSAGSDAYGMAAAATVYGNRRTEPNFTDGCNIGRNGDGDYIYELVTGRGGSGKAIHCNIAAGNQGCNWNGPWSDADINNSVSRTVVIQHWFRASPGGGPGPVGMKWIEVWTGGSSSRAVQRLQWSTNGAGNSHWRVNDGPNTSGFARTLQPIGPYLDHAGNGYAALNDGNWHRVTYLFRANTTSTYNHTGGTSPANETYTGTSSRDGRLAMWVDGHKVLDYQQALVGVTPPGGSGPWCYQSDVDWIPNGVYFQRIQYPGTNNDTQVSWKWDSDDLRVWQF